MYVFKGDKMKPLISVIVPVYNVEKYVKKCIESLLCQTYSSFEIILIDDGSTDKSGEICKKYVDNDKVLYIYKKNGGLSDARNVGITKARGKYIAFVDSDDFVDKTYLEKLYNSLQKSNAEVSMCQFEVVNTNDKVLCEYNFNYSSKIKTITGHNLLEHSFNYPNSLTNVVVWNKLYSKNLFDNIKFEKKRFFEDEYLLLPLYLKVKKIALVRKHLYFCVERPGSITATKLTYKKIKDIYDFYMQRMQLLMGRDNRLYFAVIVDYKGWLVHLIEDSSNLAEEVDKKRLYNWCQKEFNKYHYTGNSHSIKLNIKDTLGSINIKWVASIQRLKDSLRNIKK